MNRKFWFMLHSHGQEVHINADGVMYFITEPDNKCSIVMTNGEIIVDESYEEVSKMLQFAFQEGY